MAKEKANASDKDIVLSETKVEEGETKDALIEALKEQIAAMKTEINNLKEASDGDKKRTSEKKERVPCFVPFIPGGDPEQTVCVNGKITKFKKGEWVDVEPSVKSVIDNMFEQESVARANREKMKYQKQDL